MVDAAGSRAADDLASEFDFDSDVEATKARRSDLTSKETEPHKRKAEKSFLRDESEKEEKRRMRQHVPDAYTRHKQLINEYYLFYPGSTKQLQRDTSKDKTDIDVIRENHKFLWNDGEDVTWEKQLAKRYFDKLFKEYCIADLSRYKENKEVVDGKGQFVCASKRCARNDALDSWEVNFGYVEAGRKLHALVKLRLCPDCSYKLNYRHQRRRAHKKTRRAVGEAADDVAEHVFTGPSQLAGASSEPAAAQVKPDDAAASSAAAAALWSQPVETEEDKTRDNEIDDYLDQLFV